MCTNYSSRELLKNVVTKYTCIERWKKTCQDEKFFCVWAVGSRMTFLLFLFFSVFWRANGNLAFYLLNKYRPIWTIVPQGRRPFSVSKLILLFVSLLSSFPLSLLVILFPFRLVNCILERWLSPLFKFFIKFSHFHFYANGHPLSAFLFFQILLNSLCPSSSPQPTACWPAFILRSRNY